MTCYRSTLGSDVVTSTCPDCGHAPQVHPGFFDQKNLTTACVVCELIDLRDQVKEETRDH